MTSSLTLVTAIPVAADVGTFGLRLTLKEESESEYDDEAE